jgi:hypothetical protein
MLLSALAAGGIVLSPFGSIAEKTAGPEAWHGFHADGPVLTLVRAQSVGDAACDGWFAALGGQPDGVEFVAGAGEGGWGAAFRAWEPWIDEDREAIRECDELPCDVKLDGTETAAMAAVADDARHERFLGLVRGRLERYARTQERREYEFKGDPIDPWSWLETRGFPNPQAGKPAAPSWVSRRLDFAPGRMRAVRQILDRRVALPPPPRKPARAATGPLTADLWVRDVYTAHYFDGWGERVHLSCDPAARRLLAVHALVLEFDLLKKTDLISRLARPRMRHAIEENGRKYLDRAFEDLGRRAKAYTPAPPRR